jgi:hypothetical protein
MTPYELSILMHHYTSPCRHDNYHTVLYNDIVNRFREDGILNVGPVSVTEKGIAFINMILSVPMPEPAWIDPRTKDIIEEANK